MKLSKDFLGDYVEKEHEYCKSLLRKAAFWKNPLYERLRQLYNVRTDLPVYYSEDWYLRSANIIPPESTTALAIYNFKTPEAFQEKYSSIDNVLAKCREGKILPVLSNPAGYVGMDHLLPFFTEFEAPAYFVRGQYAYAASKGIREPEFVENTEGLLNLAGIQELRNICQVDHMKWLRDAIKNQDCWESRDRLKARSGERLDETRMRESLKYRYASVAFILDRSVADGIIETLDYVEASRVLLQLHVMFDHAISHGFLSHFCMDPDSPFGQDAVGAGRLHIPTLWKELVDGQYILTPSEPNQQYDDLRREHHPLAGFDIRNFDENDIEAYRHKLLQTIEDFNRRALGIKKVSKWVRIGVGLFVIYNEIGGLSSMPEVVRTVLQSSGTATVMEGVFCALNKYEQWRLSYLLTSARLE